MIERVVRWGLVIAAGLFLSSCKKLYFPEVENLGNRFLVVTGFINTSPNGISSISLSRTAGLSDSVFFVPESNALINIESSNGTRYSLSYDAASKAYLSNALSLNTAINYRLNIFTHDGKKYQSDFVECKQTPAIDSITWSQNAGDDAVLYVNTHDPTNSTRYYWWDFTETWQYETPAQTPYGLNGNRVYVRGPDEQVRVCWSSRESTDILLGNSTSLSEDVISQQPVLTIPNKDKRLNFRYSMLLRQYALTPEAHKYWLTIKKNSQELGTLFDQQPAQLRGNIYSLDDATEPVIGFVSAAAQEVKRIFIVHDDLNDWAFDPFDGYVCGSDFIPKSYPDPFLYTYTDPAYVPWYFTDAGYLYVSTKECVDCTQKGGTNRRPSFW